jgi:molybdenum ABC transporter molybdate-binding protein
VALSFRLNHQLREFTLDLDVEVGNETLVLIGPSGCGKTTTLRALAGLLRPDRGHVRINGEPVFDTERGIDLPPEQRGIGYLVQNYALFPHLSVTDNIAYGLRHLDGPSRRRRVQEVVDLVGAERLVSARPSSLSGGEQQRVALARALARHPRLLLLDEPLSALDVSARVSVRAELASLIKRLDIPVIVVTHDYEDVRVLADRVIVLDAGRALQSGSPRSIAAYPAHPFVAAFADTNLLPTWDGRWTTFDPWRARVRRQPEDAEHQWRCRILDITARGPFTRLRLDCDGHLAVVDLLDDGEERRFDTDDEVTLTVSDEHVRTVDAARTAVPRVSDRDGRGNAAPSRRPVLGASRWLVALVALILLSGAAGVAAFPGSAPSHTTLVALVAANSRDAFDAVAAEFEAANPGVDVQPSYAGTQVLFTQLEHGAQADLFVSADRDYAERATTQKLTGPHTPFSAMREVIIVPRNNPAGVEDLQDLATKPLSLVIGVDNVPIGKYTRQILDKAERRYGPGFREQVLAQVVSTETNTREVAQKAASGAADAAVVYRTDLVPGIAERVRVIPIPAEFNVPAQNYAAVTTASPNRQLAKELLRFLGSPTGQRIVQHFGYEPPQKGVS